MSSSSWALWARDRRYVGRDNIKSIPYGSIYRAISVETLLAKSVFPAAARQKCLHRQKCCEQEFSMTPTLFLLLSTPKRKRPLYSHLLTPRKPWVLKIAANPHPLEDRNSRALGRVAFRPSSSVPSDYLLTY